MNNIYWKTDPISRWYGITVKNGWVIEIEFYNNNLAGTISSLIGDFNSLKIL